MFKTKSLLFTLIGFLVISRLALTNVNSAEWGDSYSILRASNFVRAFSYPDDEKRPPLFSALLAIRPTSADAVLWGRLVMLVISFSSLFLFYKLCQKLLMTQNQRLLALIFLLLNPVYLYWSLRIYADVFFSFLVLLCLYTFELWKKAQDDGKQRSTLYLAITALVCGLAILTRFEGYLLTLSVLIGLIVIGRLEKSPTTTKYTKLIKLVLIFGLTVGISILPWLLYRNPLTSSYFEEPAGRKYDLQMFSTYLTSYLFVLGIIPAFALIAHTIFKKSMVRLYGTVKTYPHIFSFAVLESLLILAWPAAVPRLFVPIIPLLIVALVKSLSYFKRQERSSLAKPARESLILGSAMLTNRIVLTTATIFLLGLYIIIQYQLRLQFLGPHTTVFVIITILSVLSALSIFLKSMRLFLLSAIISMTALSASTIYLHKDVYRSIKDICDFSLREVTGKVVHNDTAGIVRWNFPESEYRNFDNKKYLTQEYLEKNNVTYLIITNEFDPNMEIDLEKRPYLTLIKESKYQRGGKMFFTWLVGIQR